MQPLTASTPPVATVDLTAPLAAVQASILAVVEQAPPQSKALYGSLAYTLGSRGKYLRPTVTLLMGSLLGGVTPALVESAAVAEMIHVATLLHDDVLDDADQRRGQETVRHRWNNTVAILGGDYLLAQASLKLAQLGDIRLVGLYAQVLADLCDGEVLQNETAFHPEMSWVDYERKSRLKTASLFAAGCESAALIHPHAEPLREAARGFGNALGLAFQLADDLLDLTATAETLGKPVLSDLRAGLVNAPVLLAMAADPAIGPMLADWFQSGQEEAGLLALHQRLMSAGAVEATEAQVAAYTQAALDCLDQLPPHPARDALAQLAWTLSRRQQ